jgi:hypothetical protein
VLEVYESVRDLVRLAVMLSSLQYTPGILECLQQFLNQVSTLIILRRKIRMCIGGMGQTRQSLNVLPTFIS